MPDDDNTTTSDESGEQTTDSGGDPEPAWPDVTDRETRDAGSDDDDRFKPR